MKNQTDLFQNIMRGISLTGKLFFFFREGHTGPEWHGIVHKLFLYLSEPDRAQLGPPSMIFNQELISKAFHKCQENCQILVNSWVLKLTSSDLSYKDPKCPLKFNLYDILWYIESKIWCKEVATGHNWYNKFSDFQYFLLNKDL